MTQRRELTYQNWDEVRQDLHALLAGYEQHGKWNLEQAAKHLNDWLRYPMDGFPKAPLPIRVMLSMIRISMGKRLINKIIETRKMKNGAPTAPETVYQTTDDLGASAAVAQLLDTIARFDKFQGEIHRSPIFDKMDKPKVEKLQLVHFAHHLSWLSPVPKPQA